MHTKNDLHFVVWVKHTPDFGALSGNSNHHIENPHLSNPPKSLYGRNPIVHEKLSAYFTNSNVLHGHQRQYAADHSFNSLFIEYVILRAGAMIIFPVSSQLDQVP